MAADTETNGLHHYREHRVISISVYLPELEIGYNFPFRHGDGEVTPAFDDSFYDMTWQKKDKKAMFVDYWFRRWWNDEGYKLYYNLTTDNLETLKSVWNIPKTHVYHNARFDLHMLTAEGFPLPEHVIDTLLQAHIILEDWQGAEFDAPYTYTAKDKDGVTGMWARNPDGTLATKRQNGNRRLKWQGAYLQHVGQLPDTYDATTGEAELIEAKTAFEMQLATYIMTNLEDDTLNGLVYKTVEKLMSGEHPHTVAQVLDKPTKKGATETWYDKQRNRIAAKIELDSKANMWMLDSKDVAHYAILDTWLTWALHEWQEKTIAKWHNSDLAHTVNRMQKDVAFRMENNGIVLDRKAAQNEREKLLPQIEDLQDTFNVMCEMVGLEPHSIGSSRQLADSLNELLPYQFTADIYPAWWKGERLTETYKTRLSSTGRAVLEDYDDSPAIVIVLEYRRMKKTAETYLKNWLLCADDKNIVRPGFNLDGTVAGRPSSSGEAGNFQNIPDRNGYTVKRAFVTPSEDWLFFAMDYGQLEARLAAWYAETLLVELGVHNLPPTMTNLFNGIYDIEALRKLRPDIDESRFFKPDGSVDMHSFTREMVNLRAIVFGTMTDEEILLKRGYDLTSEELDTPEKRRHVVDYDICRFMAKTMNFGLPYSGTEYMLSKLLRISLEQARPLVSAWRNLFPAFAIAQDYYSNLALEHRAIPDGSHTAQYVTQAITGRHRRLTRYPTFKRFKRDGYWQSFNPREASAKKTWNNQVQGLGGYMTPYALLRFFDDNPGAEKVVKPFAVIHDAIDGYVHRSALHYMPVLMDYMRDFPINPALTVDLEASATTWQDMSAIDGQKGRPTVEEWIAEYAL